MTLPRASSVYDAEKRDSAFYGRDGCLKEEDLTMPAVYRYRPLGRYIEGTSTLER